MARLSPSEESLNACIMKTIALLKNLRVKRGKWNEMKVINCYESERASIIIPMCTMRKTLFLQLMNAFP